MSFALQELSRLLAPLEGTVGVVVAIDGTRVRVATPTGALTVHALDALIVGDRVLIRNGQARRAPSTRRSFPV